MVKQFRCPHPWVKATLRRERFQGESYWGKWLEMDGYGSQGDVVGSARAAVAGAKFGISGGQRHDYPDCFADCPVGVGGGADQYIAGHGGNVADGNGDGRGVFLVDATFFCYTVRTTATR